VYVGLLAALARMPLAIAATMLVVAALLTAPMLPLYLVVLGGIPRQWSRRRKRLAAVAASPLLLVLYAFVLGGWIFPAGLFLLLLAAPGAFAYGALVRLSPVTPSRSS